MNHWTFPINIRSKKLVKWQGLPYVKGQIHVNCPLANVHVPIRWTTNLSYQNGNFYKILVQVTISAFKQIICQLTSFFDLNIKTDIKHYNFFDTIWAGPWENVSYVICEQQRRRSACASPQSDLHLCCSLLGWYNISSFYSRNFKTLASFCGCACMGLWPGQKLPKTHFVVSWLIFIIFLVINLGTLSAHLFIWKWHLLIALIMVGSSKRKRKKFNTSFYMWFNRDNTICFSKYWI